MTTNRSTRGLAAACLCGWLALLAGGCDSDHRAASRQGTLKWLTDLPQAQARAKAENKRVLLEFTGSDWCPPCKALHETVMTSETFEAYAATNLVLVELDFPRAKQQTDELKQANAALGRKFAIEGYPTVIVLDADGKVLVNIVGYGGEQPAEFIAKLQPPGGKAK